jgi:rhamnogalacturonyl hydrolase YesR
MKTAVLIWIASTAFAQPGVIRSAAGVTRDGVPIPVLLTADDLRYETKKIRVLLTGDPAAVNQAADWFYTNRAAAAHRKRFALSALPYAAAGPFPPEGEAYNSKQNPEAMYLWRWIGMHAPDYVIVATREPKDDACRRLACQLGKSAPSNTGTIPAIEAAPSDGFLAAALKSAPRRPSPARLEIQRRLNRTPLEVARQISAVYGKELPQAVYIPAMALIARLRLGELTRDASQLPMVEKIVAPYLAGKDSLEKATSSHLSGHLIFGELYARTKNPRYLELARRAADMGFENGAMKESMPLHNEMSDSVYMGTPILVQVGKLTGETKYFDMAMRHMRFMLKLNLRNDGLHRHSPLDETAWGRGNGFPALGLALSLSDLPENHPGRAEMLAAFRAHMDAMLPHQDPTGMWHQVVDHAESYRELTVTAMTAFAMAHGIRRGWLGRARFQKAVDRAWYALKTRIAADGSLVDVCTNTGKQKSLRDYYDRPAILGVDARGGAMAWLIANELALSNH